jgi:HD domain
VPRSLLGAAATVVTTWWLVLTFLALLSGAAPEPFFAATRVVIMVAAACILSGCLCVFLWIYIDRRERRLALVAQDMRGLVSSIGPVPMLMQPPTEAPSLPRFQAPDVPDDFYVRWLAHFDRTHPKHTALMRRMMRVMQAHRHLPASPVPGGHGDRSLLQHSLLCGFLMHDLARDFKYEGGRSKNTARLVLPLVDPNYKFNPGDPLCVIIGIAHDLGKIESYRYHQDGSVIGIKEEHDLTGARMVARMEECWDLPDSDRFAMMMALAHYHHPQELPLSPDRKAIDDRTIALMELLTIADVQASAIEHTGRRLNSAELAQKFTTIPSEHQLNPAELFTEFLQQLSQKHLVNTQDTTKCLAWLTVVLGSSNTMVLVNEGNMTAAIGIALGIDHTLKVDDGRRILTVTLLGELARRGYLVSKMKIASGEVVAYSPESALWKASFNQRTVQGQKHLFGPVIVYVIDPAKVPELATMRARAGDAVILDGVFGESRRLGAKRASQPPPDPGQATSSTPAAAAAPASSAPPAADGARATTTQVDRGHKASIGAPSVDSGHEAAPAPGPENHTEQQARRGEGHKPASQAPEDDEGAEAESFGVDPTRVSAAQPRRPPAGKGARRPRAAERADSSPPWATPAAPQSEAVMDGGVPLGVPPGTSTSPAPGEPRTTPGRPVPEPSKDASKSVALPPGPVPGGLPTERPSGREVMAALVGTINALGNDAARYASGCDGVYRITLPADVLAQHRPEIAWERARHHILGLAARHEIPLTVRLPIAKVYALEYLVPTS